jgi:hypothetical protein
MILRDSETLGNHRYKIGLENDFRKGNVYFYFDTPAYIKFYFDIFKNVEVGSVDDLLFTERLNFFFLITGIK